MHVYFKSRRGRLPDHVRFFKGRSLDEVSVRLSASSVELWVFTVRRPRVLNCITSLPSKSVEWLLLCFLTIEVSIKPSTTPQSLSSLLGVAIRIAQRMGIDSESALARCTALEAEMRRRLWWSLILFDARVSELADFKPATLNPTWDCRIPLNVNDSDFRPEMKDPPQVQGKSTETLFAVVRSEIGDFVRHTMFHLDLTSPALKPVAKDVQHRPNSESSELVSLERMIEDKYLKFCDPENPLHFMTIWTTRGYLAKCRLMEYCSRSSSLSVYRAEAQRDATVSFALSMLKCDTKVMTSPLTKGFLWLAHFYFPLTAYIHIVQNLKRRPVSDQAEQAWEIMSDNYKARCYFLHKDYNPFFKIFARIVLQAWEAREATSRQSGESLVIPWIVLSIRYRMTELTQNEQNTDTGQPDSATDLGINDFPISMPTGFGSHSLLHSMGGQDGYAGTESAAYPDMLGLASLDVDVNQLDWSAMDWDLVNAPTGEAGESIDLPLLW